MGKKLRYVFPTIWPCPSKILIILANIMAFFCLVNMQPYQKKTASSYAGFNEERTQR